MKLFDSHFVTPTHRLHRQCRSRGESDGESRSEDKVGVCTTRDYQPVELGTETEAADDKSKLSMSGGQIMVDIGATPLIPKQRNDTVCTISRELRSRMLTEVLKVSRRNIHVEVYDH